MIEYKLVNRAVLKDGHVMFDEDVVKDLNRKVALEHQQQSFREGVLSLEQHYMDEFMRLKNKPLAAEIEKKMSLLCSHILKEYDAKI